MLSPALQNSLTSLFNHVPYDASMTALVVAADPAPRAIAAAEKILKNPPFQKNPPLAAGLWLYVDDLDRSHTISQGLKDATGAFWHAIMHRREGDFGNSHYWFDRAGAHPAMALIPGYDPHAFVDEVAGSRRDAPEALVAMQRREWTALMNWCAGPAD